MTPRRRQRFILAGLLVLGVAVSISLALIALNKNINLFFSPTQVAAGEAPLNSTFRLGGMVVPGSVRRPEDGLIVAFDLTDTVQTVTVVYKGILPDLFRENQGIVAQGRLLTDGTFEAQQVLAKHDENYMPPEVADALEKARQMGLK
ncbi:MAG: cytochrome c maturation protein CcmE [Proteobacteria bacterium]|nr:cytochrome c maturation protein CcmE [Pseudomonadota bacterium]MBP11097.1 cytochrome c maturation protein CcmE [Acidiferrobacteraceae bacterium]MDP6135093.1 cytochrome c maturation protein CcmE [Arenicellales bacterium]MDP7218202.1 cytochrome c maturation protein CcmE [Arenicellales bacterium]HJP08483.1 cytochrome c maturation protein CcmE [Arenicellales bacterium]